MEGLLGPEGNQQLRRFLMEQNGRLECYGSQLCDYWLFIPQPKCPGMRMRLGKLNAFLAGSYDVQFDTHGRRIFIIVGVEIQAYQVGRSCKQEHHPQYGATKKLVKKRTHHSSPKTYGKPHSGLAWTKADSVCNGKIRAMLTQD
jgi:hypothetical protein